MLPRLLDYSTKERMSQLKAELRRLSDFLPARLNPNAGNENSVPLIVDSIHNNGAGRPMLADKDGEMIAGSHSLQAFIDAGYEEAIVISGDGQRPVIFIRDDIDIESPQGRSLQVGDNHIGLKSYTPDDELLGAILADIAADDEKWVRGAGFSEGELQALLDSLPGAAQPDPGAQIDRADELQQVWQVERGDLWAIGDHRLMCGDSTNAEDVARVMGGDRAVLMNTDPPYGIAYGEKGTQNWKGEVDRLKIASDQFQDEQLQIFLEQCFRIAADCALEINAAWYLWHAHLTQGFFAAAAAAAAANVILHRQIIWVKPSLILGMGQYHWRHEPCFFGWIEGHQPPDYGDRTQTTVWELGRQNETPHPTEKPVELFVIPIEKHTKRSEVIYEPFCGSGSQLVACEQTGRRGRGIEIAEKYCAVTLQRLHDMGLEPCRVS